MSTTAVLMPLPPTSTPIASRPMACGTASADASVSIVAMSSVMQPASEVVHRDAAITDERGAVRPARLVRGEIDRHVDDLLGLAEAAGRVAGEPDALGLLVLDQPIHEQRGLDRPRTDGVRPDPLRPELHREAAGQADERTL